MNSTPKNVSLQLRLLLAEAARTSAVLLASMNHADVSDDDNSLRAIMNEIDDQRMIADALHHALQGMGGATPGAALDWNGIKSLQASALDVLFSTSNSLWIPE